MTSSAAAARAAELDALVDRRGVADRREPGERRGHVPLPLGPRVGRPPPPGRAAGPGGRSAAAPSTGAAARPSSSARSAGLGGDGRDGRGWRAARSGRPGARRAGTARGRSPIASAGSASPKWPAKANPVPYAAAACAPYRLDPRIHTGGSGTSVGWRDDRRERVVAGEAVDVAHQLGELGREVVGDQRLAAAAQRQRRELVGAGCAADAQVDPARVQPGEDPERLGHLQRRVVGQHDPAGPDPDRRVVAAATAAIITSGAELATLAMLWCSATQNRS